MKNDYIKITELKEKQKLLLKILSQFHDFCEEYNLVYNIFGGTMLGAVRHKGIIPWDDDIDVTMPRHDYERFINLMCEKKNDNFELYVFPRKNYIYPYAKLGMKGTVLYETEVKSKYNKLSLNIDIFPNDGYPEDENILDEYNLYEQKIIMCAYKLKTPRNPIKLIVFLVRKLNASIRGVNYYLKKQIEIISKKSIEESEYIICQGAGWGKKGKLKKDVYYDRVLYDFNGLKVWGIKDYHEHLSNLYGDYMTPPPVEKQICPHDSTLFISKSIYNKYIKE